MNVCKLDPCEIKNLNIEFRINIGISWIWNSSYTNSELTLKVLCGIFFKLKLLSRKDSEIFAVLLPQIKLFHLTNSCSQQPFNYLPTTNLAQ